MPISLYVDGFNKFCADRFYRYGIDRDKADGIYGDLGAFKMIARGQVARVELVNLLQFRDYTLWITELSDVRFSDSHENCWLDLESYYADVSFSSQLDIDGLSECLNDIEHQVRTTRKFGEAVSQPVYNKYPVESHIATRVFFRKVQEEKLKNPNMDHYEILIQALSSLKELLAQDKEAILQKKTRYLKNFTYCKTIQDKLGKASKRSFVQQVILSALIQLSFLSISHYCKNVLGTGYRECYREFFKSFYGGNSTVDPTTYLWHR